MGSVIANLKQEALLKNILERLLLETPNLYYAFTKGGTVLSLTKTAQMLPSGTLILYYF